MTSKIFFKAVFISGSYRWSKGFRNELSGFRLSSSVTIVTCPKIVMNPSSTLYRSGLKRSSNGKSSSGPRGVEGEEPLEAMEGDLAWDSLGTEGFGASGDFLASRGDCGSRGGDERALFGDGEFPSSDARMTASSFGRFAA